MAGADQCRLPVQRAAAPRFRRGRLDTGFIEREIDELVPDAEPDDAFWRGAAAVALAEDEDERLRRAGRLPPQRARRNASVALGRGGNFRTIALDDEGRWSRRSSGFRDDERVVVFYEGQAFEFDRSARGSVGAAAATARSSRRCRAR